MQNWTEDLESVISRINPLQLSKIIQIGNLLREGINLDSENNLKAIKEAEKELYDHFDDSSCQVLLSIIGKEPKKIFKKSRQGKKPNRYEKIAKFDFKSGNSGFGRVRIFRL